jgi:protein-L-isoaspartate(D-aspartate) O-methyltransferase
VSGGTARDPLRRRVSQVYAARMKPACWPPLLALLCLAGCQEDTAAAPGAAAPEADSYAGQRRAMVELQLRDRGIGDTRVLEAMGRVPRHELVPAALRGEAYGDYPLPIGYEQTISQPYIVAFMTEALMPRAGDRVLEVGTGSGYQAAVLAELVAEVYTIEIVEPLGLRASEDLARLGYRNVHVRIGDGYQGWPEHAPFDAIIVTCAPEAVPQPLVDQLREGGRMIIPVGEPGQGQELYLLEKRGGKVLRRAILPVRFVPMTGEAGGGRRQPRD